MMSYLDWAIVIIPMLFMVGIAIYSKKICTQCGGLSGGRSCCVALCYLRRRPDFGAVGNIAGRSGGAELPDRLCGGVLVVAGGDGQRNHCADRLLRIPLASDPLSLFRAVYRAEIRQ